MAGKDKPKGSEKTKSRRWRFIFAAFAAVVLLAAAVVLFWLTCGFLFTRNHHLTLKKITVSSTGWWNGRAGRVKDVLGVKDHTNLFQLDLKKLRDSLEDQPSIRQATVSRILPDTLAVQIVERIPRAILFDNKSKWVIDESGIVMDRDSCVAIEKSLPVIMGIDRRLKIEPGLEMPELLPCLNLIMLTNTEFTEFRIAAVSVRRQDELTFIAFYQNEEQSYKVFMPAKNLREMLLRLRSTIAKAARTGDYRRSVNLNFKGQAVLR